MRGIVFTELLEMMEEKFGYETVDKAMMSVKPDGSSFTSVGSYPFQEMVELLTAFSSELSLSIPDLQYVFGEHLFAVFAKKYPVFFAKKESAFQFLSGLENKIHPEVHKLYPDAELPTFDIEYLDDNNITMTYHSRRKMYAFAEGLIHGCLKFFGENAEVNKEMINDDGSAVKFSIRRRV